MEGSHFPHSGAAPSGTPYNGAPTSDPNYRRDGPQYNQPPALPQQHIINGQQTFMYPPNQHQAQIQNLQGQPASGQPGQQPQGAQRPQSEEQTQNAMLGQVPGVGPNALQPLVGSSNGLAGAPGAPVQPLMQGQQQPQQAVPHEPPSHSMIELGRRYTLEVVQQPKRARMCGFGDKDRRPITPPPCIRLIITDVATGAEIDTNDIEHGLFVLNVDLWSADGLREVNLVRHSTNSPAISSTTPTSYVAAEVGIAQPAYTNPLPVPSGPSTIVRDPQYPYHYNQPGTQGAYNPYPNQAQAGQYAQPQQQYQQAPSQNQFGQQQQGYGQRHDSQDYGRVPEPPNHHVYYHTGTSVHAVAANAPRPPQETIVFDQQGNPTAALAQRMPPPATVPPANPPQGMFTRNLIGSLSASAFRLTDPNEKIGIWFVLQDLSVRTEGSFRLRFSFCNVGAPTKTPNGNPANQISIVNTGKAPILASCYSDVFVVYSAKKFPGVVESTLLSKCFATQGIKIPIRKDGGGRGRGGGGGEEFEEE